MLVPGEVSIVSERRKHGPPGANGGARGEVGINLVNGTPIPSKWAGYLGPGDEIAILTPGGGGYGAVTEP